MYNSDGIYLEQFNRWPQSKLSAATNNQFISMSAQTLRLIYPLWKCTHLKYARESGQVDCISNKLQDFETVSRGSRHRPNHTQKNIASVVTAHHFHDISPDNGLFPITMWYVHLSRLLALEKSCSLINKTFLPQNCFFRGFLCLWQPLVRWQSLSPLKVHIFEVC